MAIITPVRPKWMRREAVVVYAAQKQLRARSRAERIHNPRTVAQQANRQKMGVASQFLRGMQAMASRGFSRQQKYNGREVGAYHVALGALLREGMQRSPEGWLVDYPRVRLAEGRSLKQYPLQASRQGGALHLHFPGGLPRGVRAIRLALYCPRTGRVLHYTLTNIQAGKGVAMELSLPKWARGPALHLWWMAQGKGDIRWESQYLYLAKGRGGRSAGYSGSIPTQHSSGASHSGAALAGRIRASTVERNEKAGCRNGLTAQGIAGASRMDRPAHAPPGETTSSPKA